MTTTIAGFIVEGEAEGLILATNPTPEMVKDYVNNLPLSEAFARDAAGSGYDYHELLRMMVAQESSTYPNFRPTQINALGLPYWSQFGDRGSGIMQITNPAPTAEQIWNWKANISAGISIFNGKFASAVRYARSILASVRAELQTLGLSPSLVDPWTSTMIVEEAIRGYNGFNSNINPLHEFRPVRDDSGRLDLTTGRVRWEMTPIALRSGSIESRDYVNRVKRWRGNV